MNTYVDLYGRGMSDRDLVVCMRANATSERWTVINVSNNLLHDRSVDAVLAGCGRDLLKVNFGLNKITRVGAERLARHIRDEDSALTHLSLWSNRIGDEGAVALADAVKATTCTLTGIDIGCNDIGDVAACSIADALRHNSSLTYVNLKWNPIGAVGLRAIREAMDHNLSVVRLNVEWCTGDSSGVSDSQVHQMITSMQRKVKANYERAMDDLHRTIGPHLRESALVTIVATYVFEWMIVQGRYVHSSW